MYQSAMKAMFLIVLLVAGLPVIVVAQNAPVPASTNSPPSATDASVQGKLPTLGDSFVLPQEIGPQTAAPARPKVDGALARAARSGQVLQAVNPFAPVEFGHWYDNVNVEPHTRQPAGIVLVSFSLGGGRHAHR